MRDTQRVVFQNNILFISFFFVRFIEKTGRDNPRLTRMDLSFPLMKNNKFTWVLIVIQ
jgi:hypothetical protein